MKKTTLKKYSAHKVAKRTRPVAAINPLEIKYMTAEKSAAIYKATSAKLEASSRYLAEN